MKDVTNMTIDEALAGLRPGGRVTVVLGRSVLRCLAECLALDRQLAAAAARSEEDNERPGLFYGDSEVWRMIDTAVILASANRKAALRRYDAPRSRDGWTAEARVAAKRARLERQAAHDARCADVIKTKRAAGVSWRQIARDLEAAEIPPPRSARGAEHADKLAGWDHRQVIRIAERHDIE